MKKVVLLCVLGISLLGGCKKEEVSKTNHTDSTESVESNESYDSYSYSEQESSSSSSFKLSKPSDKSSFRTDITYDNLARTPNQYEGEYFKLTGKVLQVLEADSETQMRLAVDGDYDHVIYTRISKFSMESRILENDQITIYAQSLGLVSYSSTLGGKITIPDSETYYYEMN
ncbi:transcriptional regulator [Vagococcus entomophilus]|uniref:Lipoprotein n=1 Tax=Vagococcus entomophilus TaxID=1160095 RepID=A0A430AKG8_9ENTE|nr:transcriptional regulator [Vagococcus entomophilus]RSU08474.1 hypothetical protein CBF30_04340 [Vagococcus entomophilus]